MINLNQSILHQLKTDRDTHIKDLAMELGLKTSGEIRGMREAISEMRHKGIHILSSPKGYRLAGSLKEIQDTKKYYLKYVKSLCINLRDLRQMENNYNGQLPMVF